MQEKTRKGKEGTVRGWCDLPTELHREILSHLPFWTIQQRRGVSHQWMTVSDSINPDLSDEQSRRCYSFCKQYIEDFYRVARDLHPFTMFPSMIDWRGLENAYPREKLLDVEGQLISVMFFLKWYGKPHRCYSYPPTRGIMACTTREHVIFSPQCRCCKSCWVNTGSDNCTLFCCKSCCESSTCKKHSPLGPPEDPCCSCKARKAATRCHRKRCGTCCGCAHHRKRR